MCRRLHGLRDGSSVSQRCGRFPQQLAGAKRIINATVFEITAALRGRFSFAEPAMNKSVTHSDKPYLRSLSREDVNSINRVRMAMDLPALSAEELIELQVLKIADK